MAVNSSNSVLYLSYDGLTDPLGQSQILPYLCGLSATYAITIISFEKTDRFVKSRALIQQICNSHNLNWVALPYHKKPPVLSTLYDIWLLGRKAANLHTLYNFKIVHCRSYITSLIGLWLKRKFDVKFIFDMRGFWADERVEGNLWNLRNPFYKLIYKFFKRKEIEFLNQADHVVSLTHNAKNEILTWDVLTPVSVIPCCVELKHFDRNRINHRDQNLLRQSLGISDNNFVLLYLGSLGTWYMIEEMLAFFSTLKRIKSDAKFVIVTMDTWDLTDYPYNDDILLVKSERQEVPLYISLATYSILFIMPTFSKKASSATKMAELMAMGIPIITNSGWGDVELFAAKVSMDIVSSFTNENFEEIINRITSDRVIGHEKFRIWASENFSLFKGISMYKMIYDKLLDN